MALSLAGVGQRNELVLLITYRKINDGRHCVSKITAGLPRDRDQEHASSAFKLVLWWEEEFIAAYRRNSDFVQQNDEALSRYLEISVGCGGIVKTSDPLKFVSSVTKSSEQLLEHLHILTQEALDHADLSVLTGTIGAVALIKNCLWCYTQTTSCSEPDLSSHLQSSYKKYKEMGEALAERLLDLHCRLLSLYILQDADCLDFESTQPFFESERGSYVIQMWWLYMQGTLQDLWNTVPPKVAQRVFAGMLSECLTILTIRYSQAPFSQTRHKQMAVDISNLLLCVAKLLPTISGNAEELIGVSLNSQSKILRDVNAKCQELLACLILRGAPLDVLYKVFRKGMDNAEIFKSKSNCLSPWIVFSLPNIYKEWPKNVTKLMDLPDNIAVSLELTVLLAQPQPIWSLLLKVVCMREYRILNLILNEAIKELSKIKGHDKSRATISKCDCFLCMGDGTCKGAGKTSRLQNSQEYYDLITACSHITLSCGTSKDFSDILLAAINKTERWEQCFDRREIWNLKHPPWFEAILDLIKPVLPTISKTVVSAVQTGASMYQAMSIVLACFSQIWDCTNPAVSQLALIIQEILPANVTPMGKSTLLQILLSALYTELFERYKHSKTESTYSDCDIATTNTQTTIPSEEPIQKPITEKDSFTHKNSICSFDGTINSEEAIALAIAEAICSIDEDNKHTEQIDEFLAQVEQSLEMNSVMIDGCRRIDKYQQTAEILASDLLITNEGKTSLKIVYNFIRNNSDWFFQNLGVCKTKEPLLPNKIASKADPLLHTMFHIGYHPFDQLLTGTWQPDWFTLLNTPMGLSFERVWWQISLRWEFRNEGLSEHSVRDAHIITALTSVLKPSK